jgi:protein-disulfide isomerase
MSSGAPIQASELDHVIGAAEPVLTLIEYRDFGCPFCFAAKRPVQSLLERYDALRLIWRHFPDAQLHPGADLAAELSELAASSGQFWRAHALLLAGRTEFTRERLDSVASALGLDPAEVTLALDERRLRARVGDHISGGERAGVHGTPTFFLNGQRLEDWRRLARVVPRMLAEAEEQA